MNSIDQISSIYLMGIGGIAMGTLATMLKEKGFRVSGSDLNLYPPMSTHLESLEIDIFQGYSPRNLENCRPDLVVIGNVIRRDNPEAQFVLEGGFSYLSMPQAIEQFFLPYHRSIVVAGTHGKSTTSSLLAWVLDSGGLDPAAFIGAFVNNWGRSYRTGRGPYMILEGDEYDTAFFDKGPKFLHYRPHIGLLTSIEFDHADIFADFEAVFEAFRKFVHLIDPDGTLIVNADDANCMALARECRGRVITYGSNEQADWRLLDFVPSSGEVQIRFQTPESKTAQSLISKLPGRHNACNTLAVAAVANLVGLEHQSVQSALLSFRGVRRRQEVLGEEKGILIIDDFAHHPTAVLETIEAIRQFYPQRRLIAAFEPRTNSSRRSVFQQAYASTFDRAHITCIKHPPGMEAVPETERLNTNGLVTDVRQRGNDAHLFQSTNEIINFLLQNASSGDLILCMSNGSFDGLPQKLLQSLKDSQ